MGLPGDRNGSDEVCAGTCGPEVRDGLRALLLLFRITQGTAPTRELGQAQGKKSPFLTFLLGGMRGDL